MIKICTAFFLCLGTYCLADVQSTKEILSNYSSNNLKVLEVYNRVSTFWLEYEKIYKGSWELEKLLRAVEFSAEKYKDQVREDIGKTPSIIHPLRAAEFLWNLGSIRNVNVLTAAILLEIPEKTETTIDEIEALFGTRVAYIVMEITNDPNLSKEENRSKQMAFVTMMSLDGQLILLAQLLSNVKDLYPMSPSCSKENVDEYFTWSERLLSKLRGTQPNLEAALQEKIDDYKNNLFGFHRVIDYDFFMFDGEIIYKYFILDNNTKWRFDWQLYNQKGIPHLVGYEIEIVPSYENKYVMVIPDSPSIIFSRNGANSFCAERVDNGGIAGFHKVKVASLSRSDMWFKLDDESYWSINRDVYDKNPLSLKDDDKVEVTSLGDGRYEITIPTQKGSHRKIVFKEKAYLFYVAAIEDNT